MSNEQKVLVDSTASHDSFTLVAKPNYLHDAVAGPLCFYYFQELIAFIVMTVIIIIITVKFASIYLTSTLANQFRMHYANANDGTWHILEIKSVGTTEPLREKKDAQNVNDGRRYTRSTSSNGHGARFYVPRWRRAQTNFDQTE